MGNTFKRATVGTRTINGTVHAVEHLCQRVVSAGPLRWVLVKYLCNGTPDSSETFTTKRDLVARFNELTAA